MTVTVSVIRAVELPDNGPLSRMGSDGHLMLWPGGVGSGPVIRISLSDWRRLSLDVAETIEARRIAVEDLARYRATEGNGDAL